MERQRLHVTELQNILCTEGECTDVIQETWMFLLFSPVSIPGTQVTSIVHKNNRTIKRKWFLI